MICTLSLSYFSLAINACSLSRLLACTSKNVSYDKNKHMYTKWRSKACSFSQFSSSFFFSDSSRWSWCRLSMYSFINSFIPSLILSFMALCIHIKCTCADHSIWNVTKHISNYLFILYWLSVCVLKERGEKTKNNGNLLLILQNNRK